MAIDATRGLPSFSEMLSAFRNRGSLASALNAGVQGVEKGIGIAQTGAKNASQQRLETAQTGEAEAHGRYYDAQAAGGAQKKVPLAALPESIKPQLAAYVDAEGNVPEAAAKVALATTEQGGKAERAAEMLKVQQEALDERTKSQARQAQLEAELNRIREESGNEQRSITANKGVIEATKDASPTLLQRGVNFVKEGVTGQPLDVVLQERQNRAATEALARKGGVPSGTDRLNKLEGTARLNTLENNAKNTVTDKAVGIRPTPANPVRQKAIDALTEAGAPITDANIKEAIRQLGQQ